MAMSIFFQFCWILNATSKFSSVMRLEAFVALAAAAACFSGQTARAQSGLEPPPVFQAIDRFGVDIVSGTLSVSSPSITIGDVAHGGLSFSARWDDDAKGWRYSNWGEITREFAKPDPYCFAFYTVMYMGSSNVFQREECNSLNFDRIDGHGHLVENTNNFVYTANDGSIATYNKGIYNSPLIDIARPNGEIITYTYTSGPLTSISNNYGYQLHFEYAGTTLTKVTALNNAVDACALTASSCSYSQMWPSLTFTQSGLERHVTDNLGRTIRIILDSNDLFTGKVVGVAHPSKSSGSSVTYTQAFIRCGGTRVTSVTDGAGTWTYSYDVNAPNPGTECPPKDWDDHVTSVTAPNGGVTNYTISYEGRSYWTGQLDQEILLLPNLKAIQDPLGRTTHVYQTGVGLHSAIYPEGNKVTISRNSFGGVTRIRSEPKPGSGLVETNIYAVYPDCAAEPVLCRFPSSTTDERGGVTDYTYDAAGNLLTVTGPAPTPGAPRPQTRYQWEQRYAWYKQNGSSAITQAPSPVWVQVGSSQCMTGATC